MGLESNDSEKPAKKLNIYSNDDDRPVFLKRNNTPNDKVINTEQIPVDKNTKETNTELTTTKEQTATEKNIVEKPIETPPKKEITPENFDINGEYDELAIQKTNNCWSHAGLATMAQTEEGQDIIKRNISRDPNKGITTVTIPESGKSFEITDKELLEGMRTQSYGDPDVTAYNIAFEKYLGTTDTNSAVRVFEMMTGESSKIILGELEDGIPIGIRTIYTSGQSEQSQNELYNDICENINQQSGCFTLNTNILGSNHIMSVTGVDIEGRLIVEESNNSEYCAKKIAGDGNYNSFTDENGDTRYQMYISRERFSDIVRTVGTYKLR